ncbi:ArsR/SmtB family transcription factor [Caldalkalibacillus salinus]|uniref:ArsR/SmtB family transcription factor n=1 Tax=Caldalkalibacillus salinus TaxID=2803787 RepID=UPI001924EBF4|nr:metalloregulator ArsR/SmtB family transcription factor [Caldalkalibacillus salinus]
MIPEQKHDVFQAIADPTRRKMLRMLAEKEQSVTHMSRQFPISRTAVSKHLRILAETQLVRAEKVGKEKRYTLQPEALQEVKEWLSYFEQFWDNKLAQLKHLVEEHDDQPLKGVKKQTTMRKQHGGADQNGVDE